MESAITNLEKTTNAFGITSWTFDYYGIKTLMIEAEWNEDRKVFEVEILMKMPEGRYLKTLEVSAELLRGHESVALLMAAEQCLKSYENKVKGK